MGIDELKKWAEENNLSLRDIKDMIEEDINNKREKAICDKVKSHEKLIGKCFKTNANIKKTRYCKVISNRASNEYKVTCIIFDKQVSFDFNLPFRKMYHPGDMVAGRFYFDGIEVDEIMVESAGFVLSLKSNYTEISEEEFREAYDNYCNELYNFDWEVKDHGYELLHDNEE